MSFNILVVDDTKFMRKMLTDILKQYGYEVVGEAENGRQAVQRYEELRPDVVLMDITMPEMDGIDAMKAIRQIDSDAVVLICSAMSQQDLISDALKAGANGYVMKPFKPNRVNEIIRKYGSRRVVKPHEMLAEQAVHYSSPSLEELPEVQEAAVIVEIAPAAVQEPVQEIAEPEEERLALAVEEEAEPEEERLALAVEEEAEPEEERLALAVEEEAEPEEERLALAMEEEAEPEAYRLALESEEPAELQAEAAIAVEPSTEPELEPELEEPEENILPLSILESREPEFSLDDLNDLTLDMAAMPLAPYGEQTEQASFADQGVSESNKRNFKAVEGGKIINLFRGYEPMKNFTSSYMCNWNEEVNGEMSQFLVICTESENKIAIEMTGTNNQKVIVNLSIDGFNQLGAWLQDKLGNAPANVRELSKRADF